MATRSESDHFNWLGCRSAVRAGNWYFKQNFAAWMSLL